MKRRTVSFRHAALALALAAGLAASPSRGASGRPTFARYGTEAGIPGEIVTAILRDREGYLWVGTRNGLARFDGYGCVVFDHDSRDPASLSDNLVRTIMEDSRGRLWVGTNSGGLNMLRRETGGFVRHRHDAKDASTISHDSVYAIAEDRDGSLWVGTQVGLNRLDPASGRFERFLHDEAHPGKGPTHDYVVWALVDRANRLWLATFGGGVNVRDPQTGLFTAHREAEGGLPSDRVLAVAEDESGRVWAGTYSGVAVLDAQGSFRRTLRGEGRDVLGGMLVSAMAADSDGVLWITDLRGRIAEVDTRTESVRLHELGAEVTGGAQPPRLLALAAGDGILWAGSWGRGLLQARPRDVRFVNVTSERRAAGVPEVVDVVAAFLDSRGRLWAAALDAGILRRDTRDAPFALVETNPGTLCFAETPGFVWAGKTSGVMRVVSATDEARTFQHRPGEAGSLGPGYVASLLGDRDGRLWIGLGGSGLWTLREDGESFEQVASSTHAELRLTDDYVTAIFEDSRGLLWVGTRSGGLNAIDRQARRCVQFPPGPAPGGLSHHYVTALHEDRRGRLWVGTSGGGVNRALLASRDVSGLTFELLSEEQGLSDDDIMCIAGDTDSTTWLSTKRGVVRLSADDAATSYGLQDGLPSLEFNSRACLATPSALHFGGPRGLVATPTGTPLVQPSPSPLVVSAVRRSGVDEIASHAPLPEGGIELRYRDWISVEFAVLDMSPGRNHRYEYRLGGPTAPWIDLRGRREITFMNLAPGTHALEARARNTRGAWTTLAAPVVFRVVPPFWMTGWFRALAAALLAAAALAAHGLRLRALRRRNEELLKLQVERERALAEARRGEESLRVLAGRLEAAKEDERKRLARELHDELGQSLTAVKVNLELAKRQQRPADAAARLDDGARIVERLIGNVRSLSLDLRSPLMDEQGLVPALRAWLGEQARRTGLEIELAAGAPGERAHGDVETAAFRIAQEAVTNAVRHAQATQVRVALSRTEEWLDLAVEDDGRGFDSEAVLARAAHGEHVGLLGMTERVRACGGEVRVESAPGEGTTVRVRLPWKEAA